MRKGKTDVKSLVEAYFDGLTSLKEEQFLRDYFREDDLPETLKAYQPIFRYLTAERVAVHRRTRLLPLRRNVRTWSAVAAAVLLLCFALPFAIRTHNAASAEISQVYINGKKHTNIELIRSEALKSLEHLAESNESAISEQVEVLESLF
jgi:cell division septal protein FtsQ